MSFLRWGGRGGEGGSIDTQLGSCHFLGGEGGEGRGRGVDRHSTWKGSAKTLEGLPLPICHADPGGGGFIDTQLGKDLQRLWKDHLCQSANADPGGGSIDTQLGSCHFLGGEGGEGRGGRGGGVNRHSTWKGSADFGRITSANLPMLILGEGVD